MSNLGNTSRLRWLLLGGLFASMAAPAERTPAGTIRDDVARSEYDQLLESDDAFASVGHIRWRENGGSFNGSGVVISDEWVLTAAHVVAGTDLAGGGITSMSFEVNDRVHSAAEWIPHPEWSSLGGSLSAGVDIGLVRLSRPTSAEPVTLYEGTSESGEIGTIVGYGNQGTGATGYRSNTSGTALAGQNVVDQLRRSFRSVHPTLMVDFDNPNSRRDSSLGSRSPLPLEYLAAPGDSGGGLFIDVGGQQQLAGIVSFVSSLDSETDSDYGDQAGFTRVSAYLDWIDEIIGTQVEMQIEGDFDGDGQLTLADIDRLVEDLVAQRLDASRDLNNDRFLDVSDSVYLVENVFGTTVGDVNLDGQFNSTDFVQLFQFGEYEDELIGNSKWSTGDWNADGDFTSADLVFALQVSEFEAGSSTLAAIGATAVPEPTFGLSALVAFGILVRGCRRR